LLFLLLFFNDHLSLVLHLPEKKIKICFKHINVDRDSKGTHCGLLLEDWSLPAPFPAPQPSWPLQPCTGAGALETQVLLQWEWLLE
jgi:hypothetical protein